MLTLRSGVSVPCSEIAEPSSQDNLDYRGRAARQNVIGIRPAEDQIIIRNIQFNVDQPIEIGKDCLWQFYAHERRA